MDISDFLGKKLNEVKLILDETFKDDFSYEFVKILSPRNDILGQDERVIKVEEKDKLIIYYSLF